MIDSVRRATTPSYPNAREQALIKESRIKKRFLSLSRISSESGHEAALARKLTAQLKKMGARVIEDKAAKATGGDCGNIIARFGARGPFLMLNAHMDTVKPGKGVRPVTEGDLIKTDGSTILGADCKSGIAVIMEAIEATLEEKGRVEGVEAVFTVCEEIGLLGAKNLDAKMLKSRIGIALDSTDPHVIITSAPAANRLTIDIHGLEAHAGIAPEKGISAAVIAAEAIRAMKLGKIDHETTANIGIIEGGTATNIVPAHVRLEGEARSHSRTKLQKQTRHMVKAAETACRRAQKKIGGKLHKPKAEAEILPDYPSMKVKKNSPALKLLDKAGAATGMKLSTKAGSGGSDANIFNSMGIQTVIAGTGMTDVHSTRESIRVGDMVKAAVLIHSCINLFTGDKK